MITGFLIYGISIAASLGGLGGLYGQLSARDRRGAARVRDPGYASPRVQDAPTPARAAHGAGADRTSRMCPSAMTAHAGAAECRRWTSRPGKSWRWSARAARARARLLNLIPRFYDPTGGAIRIDGHDLRDVTQESLREQIGIVPQETILFGGTIRENILYGRSGCDRSRDDRRRPRGQCARVHHGLPGAVRDHRRASAA